MPIIGGSFPSDVPRVEMQTAADLPPSAGQIASDVGQFTTKSEGQALTSCVTVNVVLARLHLMGWSAADIQKL